MASEGRCGWLMSLAAQEESAWGNVDGFYDGFLAVADRRLKFTIDSEVWGKLKRKEPFPKRGDGFGFYHSSRAQMPHPDPWRGRPRLSLIGTLKSAKRDGVNIEHISVEIRSSDIKRMRSSPVVRDDHTKALFEQCELGKGAPATFYYVPPSTWSEFEKLAGLPRSESDATTALETDNELAAFEGERRRFFVAHRAREARLRDAKIAAAIAAAVDGKLKCEVPGCGFDFERVYGDVGRDFLEIHHLQPLSSRDESSLTTLDQLALVCANCHRMIHRGGQSRPLRGLIAGQP